MKIWVLLLVVALLFALSVYREGFEATSTIKRLQPGVDDEKIMGVYQSIPVDLRQRLDGVIKRNRRSDLPPLTTSEKANNLYFPLTIFYDTVYKPATTPITVANIDTFLQTFGISPNTPESDKQIIKDFNRVALISYFIPTAAYDAAFAELGQSAGYSARPAPIADPVSGVTTVSTLPPPPSTTGGNGVPGSGGMLTGSTTGGSSTSAGPNSGSSDRRNQVFGPLFTSVGNGRIVDGGDSSKTNRYPKLLGGGDSRKAEKNSSMPTAAGLGANEDSKFLPTSRVPGDMEKIPDPYRVSQQFSASNYSFKTDPVPFLTDFSAFQK
jgi:hypothetical protein